MIGAVDIGGTKIAVGLADRDGSLHAVRVFPSAPSEGWQIAVERIAAALTESGEPVEGIGIGSTGLVDCEAGVLVKPDLLPGWHGAPIGPKLAERFGVSVTMENDADAGALAEWRWGAGRGAECFLYVTIGTGIGVGVVNHGNLYRGSRGAHPELGHLSVDSAAGTNCYCGTKGCWESLASGSAGEQDVERRAWYIGLGLVNLVTAFCPDVIALGGGVMQGSPRFLNVPREMVRTMVTQVPAAHIRIVRAEGGSMAGLKGAAAAWLQRQQELLA